MCGITGILYPHPSRRVEPSQLRAMNETLTPRGPDEAGFFVKANVGLAMRRLAIIDVQGGQQPAANEDQSIQVIQNGEIYNFKELREGLAKNGHRFRSDSDTEVLPHLYEEKGPAFVEELNGMFAIAIWDDRYQQLILARDRMGKKPLYYYSGNEIFLFASELKALLAYPNLPREISSKALEKYLLYEYIPAPETIFKNIWKLPAGFFGIWKGGQFKTERYWDIPANGSFPKTIEEAQDELELKLKQAVKRRLISDVPLGAFLSGGIDSSTIVALMAEHLPAQRVKTFSIGFDEASFDESSYARQVARYFGVEHHEEKLSVQKMLAILPEVINFLDEPLGDASILPTYLLSRFTRQHVTVALGGDGGDELFAGYPTFLASKWARIYEKIPATLRKNFLEPAIQSLPVSTRYFSLDFKLKQFVKGTAYPLPQRHIIWTGSFSPPELTALLSHPADTTALFAPALACSPNGEPSRNGNNELCLYQKLYLQDDILTKVDRASMACSLEVRAPFLDKEIVEFVSPLPYRWKLKGWTMKHLLKKLMRGKLPKNILHRRKQGFAIPVAEWLKNDLKAKVIDTLHPTKINREGFFDAAYVQQLLREHTAGQANHSKKLWTLLMFEWWLKRWVAGSRGGG